MMVQSALSLYALVIGLKYAELIYTILMVSFLGLIPFVGLMIEAFHRVSTISFGNLWDASFRYTSFRIIAMLFTITFCFIPFQQLKVSEIDYPETCTASGQQINTTSHYGDTGTTYDNAFQSFDIQNVKIPIMLDAVMSFAAGISYAIQKSTPCITNINDAIETVVTSRLQPQTAVEVGKFREMCYYPAATQATENPPSKDALATYTQKYGDGDLHWLGSHYLLDNVYPNIVMRESIKPFPYNKFPSKTVDDNYKSGSIDQKPQYGFPTCAQWWSDPKYGLKEQIYNDVESYAPKGNKHIGNGIDPLTSFSNWVKQKTGYQDASLSKDIIIKEALYNPDSFYNQHQIIGGEYGNGVSSDLDRAAQQVTGAVQGVKSVFRNWFGGQQADEQKAQTILPIIIAVSLFIALTLFPLFMVGTGYSFQSFLTLSGIIFGLMMSDAVIHMLNTFMMTVGASMDSDWQFPAARANFMNFMPYVFYTTPFLLSGVLGGLGYVSAGMVGGAVGNMMSTLNRSSEQGSGTIESDESQLGQGLSYASKGLGKAGQTMKGGGAEEAISGLEDGMD